MFLLFDAKMATQEEMSRYFWSASTNCPPVPRPGLPRLSPRPHTKALGTRLILLYYNIILNAKLPFQL